MREARENKELSLRKMKDPKVTEEQRKIYNDIVLTNEGVELGLYSACKTIKEKLVEFFPDLLEKETCEIG
jgi:hypothetical protein